MAAIDLRGRTVELRLNRGDACTVTVDYTDDAGDPLDVSGYDGWTAAIIDAPGGTTVATFTVDDTDAATGTIALTLTSAQTSALTARSYAWYVTQTEVAGQPQTVITGGVVIDARGAKGAGAVTDGDTITVEVTASGAGSPITNLDGGSPTTSFAQINGLDGGAP